jgi:hypothetical protein
VKIHVVNFSVITSWNLAGKLRKRKQYVPSNRWYLPTRLHRLITPKTTISDLLLLKLEAPSLISKHATTSHSYCRPITSIFQLAILKNSANAPMPRHHAIELYRKNRGKLHHSRPSHCIELGGMLHASLTSTKRSPSNHWTGGHDVGEKNSAPIGIEPRSIRITYAFIPPPSQLS